MLGMDDFFVKRVGQETETKEEEEKNPISKSIFSNDEIITQH